MKKYILQNMQITGEVIGRINKLQLKYAQWGGDLCMKVWCF